MASYANITVVTDTQRDNYAAISSWFIENFPTSFLTSISGYYENDKNFRELKRKWLHQVRLNSTNLTVLRHAAYFCAQYDSTTAEKLWKQAQSFDSSIEWPFKLTSLYLKRASEAKNPSSTVAARKAIEQWMLVCKGGKDLKDLPEDVSYADLEKTEKEIRKLLK